mgnify:CR=1 FL=1
MFLNYKLLKSTSKLFLYTDSVRRTGATFRHATGQKDAVKALRTDKQASSWKGEKALYKSNMSVMGRVKFEVGQLYDSPGITLQETVPLKKTKSVGGKMLSAFSSVSGDSDTECRPSASRALNMDAMSVTLEVSHEPTF